MTTKKRITAFKLVRMRKNGSLGPLFINRRQVIPINRWLHAECHPTKGFALRPGWHCCAQAHAPHLTMKGRVWCKVLIDDYVEHQRPKAQGGLWYLANRMKVLDIVEPMPGWRTL